MSGNATGEYDPFARGPHPVGVRTVELLDERRARRFPCEVWYPATASERGRDVAQDGGDAYPRPDGVQVRRQAAVRDARGEPGSYPFVLFAHGTVPWRRRSATYLCTHLASRGYVVAALDHSETLVPELARRPDETETERSARVDALIAARVPDVTFALDALLGGAAPLAGVVLDHDRVAIAGYSFGGWTALAATATDRRIGATVALAPAGSARPKPGIIPATLDLPWDRPVPVLLLAAQNDVAIPLDRVTELFERCAPPKRLFVLRRADHVHFLDAVEEEHEALRASASPPPLDAMAREMQPIAELTSGDIAHAFARGLTTAHYDAELRDVPGARELLERQRAAALLARGIPAFEVAAAARP